MKNLYHWQIKFAKLQKKALKVGNYAVAAKLSVVVNAFSRRALEGDYSLSENIAKTYEAYKKSL